MKKNIQILTAVVLSCTALLVTEPVSAENIYPEIPGYENLHGAYYKKESYGRLTNEFILDQDTFYLEKGEYFPMFW